MVELKLNVKKKNIQINVINVSANGSNSLLLIKKILFWNIYSIDCNIYIYMCFISMQIAYFKCFCRPLTKSNKHLLCKLVFDVELFLANNWSPLTRLYRNMGDCWVAFVDSVQFMYRIPVNMECTYGSHRSQCN